MAWKKDISLKTAILFYSYTGKTKALAEKRARKEKADLFEVKDEKRPSVPGAYVAGSLKARRQKKAKLADTRFDFSGYDRFILAVPLWAGFPAPPFNNMVEQLPKGQEFELIITSGSGDSAGSKKKTLALAAAKGRKIVKYLDVKS